MSNAMYVITVLCMLIISGCVEDNTTEDLNITYVNNTTADQQINNISISSDTIINTTNDTKPTKKIISLEDAKEQTAAGLGGMGGGSGGGSHHHSSSDSSDNSEVSIPTETPTEIPVEIPTETPTPIETPVETPTEVPTETPTEVPTETPIETPTETPTEIPYQTNAQMNGYDYCIRGVDSQFLCIVYGGLNEYLDNLPDEIYYHDTPPTTIDFIMRDLDEPNQKLSLDPLVSEIQNITPIRDDQARIAISIVQHIPYDWDSAYVSNNVANKYPYETLYTNKGVCGQKSELLAYLLRGLGYEIVLFDFEAVGDLSSHEAVGIKCPIEYSYNNTGYAFVESTQPTIATDSYGEYFADDGVTTVPLPSNPTILKICDGVSFDSIGEEYNDYLVYNESYNIMQSYPDRPLNESEYAGWKAAHDKWQAIVDKYDIQIDESSEV